MANEDDPRKAFGAALSKRRRELGLSQRQLAEQVNERAGTTYSDASIGQWENGEHVPGFEIVFALAEVLRLGGGDLSHHLGYVPAGAVSVLDAIAADPTLSPKHRRAVEVLYLTLSSDVES